LHDLSEEGAALMGHFPISISDINISGSAEIYRENSMSVPENAAGEAITVQDLTPAAMRAARGLLGLGTFDAAARIGVSSTTWNQIEKGAGCRPSTLRKVVDGLAREGIEIVAGGGWTGARLRLDALPLVALESEDPAVSE
jgi:DNA-binding XRE family transcriptional regulator